MTRLDTNCREHSLDKTLQSAETFFVATYRAKTMKKLLIGLAAAGLFSGAGIALACDYQNDASVNVTPMSKAAPVVIACEGSGCPAPRAIACEGAGCPAPRAIACEQPPCEAPRVIACDGDKCDSPTAKVAKTKRVKRVKTKAIT
jgi:hypothetical protein